jgi:hypothetical protein
MTKMNAIRFGEYIAENNNHFDEWCRQNHYAHTNMYGAFAMYPLSARKALSEYRKAFGFTESEYRNWNKDWGWHYGTMGAKVRI